MGILRQWMADVVFETERPPAGGCSVLLWGLFAVVLMAPAGCGSYGTVATEGVDTVSVALPASAGGGSANLFLYRITSRETGERLGVGRSFHVQERRQVRAVLQFEDVPVGTPLLIHTMWINPDGKELFTKEVYVAREDWTDGARRDSLAGDLVMLDAESGRVEIESRYGVSPARFEEEFYKDEDKRTFKTGTWEVRTYLYRKRLLQTDFELLPME